MPNFWWYFNLWETMKYCLFSVSYFNTMTTYISFTLGYHLKIYITFTLPCELSQEQVSVLWKSQAWRWTIPFPLTWQSINSTTNWPGLPCLYTLHNDVFITSILYFWGQLTCIHTFLLKVMFTAQCYIGIISVWTILYGCCSCQNILHFFHICLPVSTCYLLNTLSLPN